MSENSVHIRLEYTEAMIAKRSILSAEMNLLKAIQAINRYKATRLTELSVKGRLASRMKEARSTIKALQSYFPEPKLPRILKHHKHQEESGQELPGSPRKNSESVEAQLREIQRRLDALSR